jgi:phage shock protein A
MRRQISKLEKIQEGWTEKAELALSKGREDLAKAALVEKRKAGDMADQLRVEIQVLDDGLRASEEDIAKLQARLRDARTRQNAIMSRIENAGGRDCRASQRGSGRRRTRSAESQAQPKQGRLRRWKVS